MGQGTSARKVSRRKRAVESFGTAAACIGKVEAGMSLFALTRGQFSMIDAVLHVIEACAPAKITLWTWRIAEYELESFQRVAESGDVTQALLVTDRALASTSKRNDKQRENDRVSAQIVKWRQRFGDRSVSYLKTHAKIATVEGNGLRVLLRGSMNLNFNPRFEQLDVTEGGPDFDLIREVEADLPILDPSASNDEVNAQMSLGDAVATSSMSTFGGLKPWKK